MINSKSFNSSYTLKITKSKKIFLILNSFSYLDRSLKMFLFSLYSVKIDIILNFRKHCHVHSMFFFCGYLKPYVIIWSVLIKKIQASIPRKKFKTCNKINLKIKRPAKRKPTVVVKNTSFTKYIILKTLFTINIFMLYLNHHRKLILLSCPSHIILVDRFSIKKQ